MARTFDQPSTRADTSDRAGFEFFFSSAPAAMALVSRDGAVLRHNAAFEALAGGHSTRNLADLVVEADRARIRTLLALPDFTIPTPAEVRLSGGTAEPAWALLSLWPVARGIASSGSRVLQLIDIDARKREEIDLREREARWNNALESASQGVWDHDFARGNLFYSRRWKTLRGLAPDAEVDGSLENWIQLVHPDDRVRVLEEIRKQENGEAPFHVFAYRERHADGHWIWIESRGAVVDYDDNGKPSRIAGTDTDITGRKEAEARLEQMSRRLALALDVSQIGVFEADLEGDELHWDRRMMEIYGRSAPVTCGDDWYRTIHPEDRAAATRVVDDALARQSPFVNAYRILREDGEVRHIRARAAHYLDADGKPRLIGANWDVTEDVRRQQELQQARTLAEARAAELEAARSEIEHSALHDHLTGLPNRRYLDRFLSQCATGAAGTQRLALLHIDLDRFKEINDTLGHKAGDRMLVHAADLLRAHARGEDFVARVGGDEFVFAACGNQERNLAELASSIVGAMREPVTIDGHICRFGASIGIATDVGGQTDAHQLLINADLALYRAKNKGRGRHEFFSHEIQTQISASRQTADEILAGIEECRFVPVYQPQFCARSLDFAGVETLARWEHPRRGQLAPDSFLAIAEEIGVVAAIDRQILEAAVADLHRWEALGIAVPKLSVNVSSRRLHEPDLGTALQALDVDPRKVSFELLESIFLDDCDRTVLENLADIRRFGIDIEIDDFGTGHASIVSLLKLRPRRLKIDRQLIRPIVRSPAQRKLVGTIIEIGRSLDIGVVAEGVETAAHVAILRELGCDLLQGYALAHPMGADALVEFVKGESWRTTDSPVHRYQEQLKSSLG
ncbi:EAL domain-containing protein [Rhizobium sp. TRM95111]|uniref:sensor domain-containing protein n=1 Tax=Rhizobium alarense TaxID=2846851 RepID=UPI001F16459D|nr:EAL domain-containing protein [Rhizobium alarense]MCF3639045.1 EAL domain-containing protein [Rhizobium alarense]